MIVAFNTQIDDDWIIDYSILVCCEMSQKLSLGNSPSIAALNPNSPLPAGESPYTYRWYTGPGEVVFFFVHGSEDQVWYDEIHSLTANEFCERYRRISSIKGLPLVLMACETGKNENGLAKDIANILKVPVIAPRGSIIFSKECLVVVPERNVNDVAAMQEQLENDPNYKKPEGVITELIKYITRNGFGRLYSWEHITNIMNQFDQLELVKFQPDIN